MAISKENLERLKDLLESEQARIKKNIEALSDMDFGNSPGDSNEEADESEEAANDLATIETLKERVARIDDALEKIKNGSYGTCGECGAEIDIALLEVDPESTLCKECKA